MIKDNLANRLNSADNQIFKEAFLEVNDSYLYAQEKLLNTAPCWFFKKILDTYQERFNKITSLFH